MRRFQTNSREVEAAHQAHLIQGRFQFQTNSREVEARIDIEVVGMVGSFQTNSREVEAFSALPAGYPDGGFRRTLVRLKLLDVASFSHPKRVSDELS